MCGCGWACWCSIRAPGPFWQLTLQVVQMNITIFRVFAVSAVCAPVLGHIVDIPAFTDPAPPETPCLRVSLEFRVFRLLIFKVITINSVSVWCVSLEFRVFRLLIFKVTTINSVSVRCARGGGRGRWLRGGRGPWGRRFWSKIRVNIWGKVWCWKESSPGFGGGLVSFKLFRNFKLLLFQKDYGVILLCLIRKLWTTYIGLNLH